MFRKRSSVRLPPDLQEEALAVADETGSALHHLMRLAVHHQAGQVLDGPTAEEKDACNVQGLDTQPTPFYVSGETSRAVDSLAGAWGCNLSTVWRVSLLRALDDYSRGDLAVTPHGFVSGGTFCSRVDPAVLAAIRKQGVAPAAALRDTLRTASDADLTQETPVGDYAWTVVLDTLAAQRVANIAATSGTTPSEIIRAAFHLIPTTP